MNDNRIIEAGHKFGQKNGSGSGPGAPTQETKLTPTMYRIVFKNPAIEPKEVLGYLGIGPLFIAITDGDEKITFMLPHGDYLYVEALLEYEVLQEPESVDTQDQDQGSLSV